MTNEEEDYLVALMADLPNAPPPPSSPNPHRPISSSSTTTKPNPKFLYLLLRAAVMAVAISLFFLFIGIAAVVLIHICIAGRALTRRRGRRIPRTGRGGDHASLVPCLGLSRKELQQLPCFDYGFEFEPASDCAVCLEGFREGELCRILPGCNHVFHVGCIDKWLVKVAVCPICRNCVEFKGFDVASVDALEAI